MHTHACGLRHSGWSFQYDSPCACASVQVTILQWVPPVQQLHYLHRFESSISAFGSSQFVRRHAIVDGAGRPL